MSAVGIQAVIFDSDGTLVDTERLSITVLCEQFGLLGIDVPVDQAVANWAGRDLHEVLRNVATESGQTIPDSFLDDFRDRQLAKLESEVQPIRGAADLLRQITMPKCVASNAPVVKVELCLRTTGLLDYFHADRLFSAYQVNEWKPNPAVFLHAAKEMGFAPENCAVVEDSESGVQAGIAAGMTVFALDPNSKLPAMDGVAKIKKLTELVGVLT